MDIKEITKKVVQVSNKYSKNCSVRRDDDWYVLKLQEEVGELVQNYLSFTGRGRKRGQTEKEIRKDFSLELADVMSQVLLIADHHEVNIESALNNKWFKYLK